jgi:hypothetical protein
MLPRKKYGPNASRTRYYSAQREERRYCEDNDKQRRDGSLRGSEEQRKERDVTNRCQEPIELRNECRSTFKYIHVII